MRRKGTRWIQISGGVALAPLLFLGAAGPAAAAWEEPVEDGTSAFEGAAAGDETNSAEEDNTNTQAFVDDPGMSQPEGAPDTHVEDEPVQGERPVAARLVPFAVSECDTGTLPYTHAIGTSSFEVIGATLCVGPGTMGTTDGPWGDSLTAVTRIEFVQPEATSLPAISASLFQHTTAEEIVGIESVDTSNVIEMRQMFYDARSLVSLDLSAWNTSNVSTMRAMFFGTDQLFSLDTSGWDTSRVTDMTSMFYDARSLVSLDVSGWDTSNVTDMTSMFYEARSLVSLDTSGWDTSNVTGMGRMFYSARSLESLDVSGWDTARVTTMGAMFNDARSLGALDVSGWDTARVTTMGAMFAYASSLGSLDVSGWDTSNVTEMTSMFSNASSLGSLDVSGWDTSNVTSTYTMFAAASALESLDVSGWDTSNVTDMTSMFAGASSLVSLDLSAWETRNVVIMSGLFAHVVSLVSLDVSTWDTSGVIDMRSMFAGASSLSSLDLSGWDTGSVRNMGGLFYGADALSRLVLGSDTTLHVDADLVTPAGVEPLTGLWEIAGGSAGACAFPSAAVWEGSADDLITRSGTGVGGTYTWQAHASEVIPAPPVQNGAVITIPAADGWTYCVDGAVIPGQDITLVSGDSLTVMAFPSAGFAFPDATTRTWEFTYTTPVPTPTPVPSHPVTNTSPAAAQGLASTGSHGEITLALIGLAVILFAAGGITLTRRVR